MTTIINEEVNVNAFYFAGKEMKVFPRQIEWEGRPVTFAEAGLRMLVRKGSQLVQLFDMTDGATTYRLKHEGSHWTLIGTRAGV